MTFIKSQAEALERHVPVYVGAHRINEIALPPDRTIVVNDRRILGFVREALFRRWGYAPKLINSLKKHDPRIVHTHFGTCGPAGMTLAQSLDVPHVVTFHGHDATISREDAAKTFRGRELFAKKSLLISNTDKFIAVSNYIRQKLLDQGYPDRKIIVHRNGINLQDFDLEKNRPTDPIIVFVGRFVEKKGMKYLISAAAKLNSDGVKFKLVIIGSGPLESECRKTVNDLGIPCTFTGFLVASEVRTWIQKARVVAVPSVVAANGDAEGLPTILLEAQALETPIVGTRHSGIPEGVQEGKTAELVDERDSDGLAYKLRTFLESAEKADAFGRAGRRFMFDHFDMRAQNKKLEDLFEELYSSR